MAGFNLALAGFRNIDSSSMEIVRNNIDKHMKRIAELTKKIENLHITLKTVHEREKSEKYDIRVKLNDNGKIYAAHSNDRNLFVAIDMALEKLIHELD